MGCPTPLAITVTQGGSFQINASSCNPFGTNPQDRVVQPSHGTVTIDNPDAGLLTYVHNGDSSTTDSFTFEDASSGVVTVNVTITPQTSPITITPGSIPVPSIGAAYSQALSATGGVAPYGFSVSSGSLPPGLSLSTAGTISGVATGAGPYSFSVHATDSTSGTALTGSKSYSVTVPAPNLTVAPSSPAAGITNVPYSLQFSTSGGTEPYSYSLESGSLPTGLSLSSSGLLHGTPTLAGSFPFTLRVTDSTTFSTGGQSFVLKSVSVTLTATGGTQPYGFALESGSLPPGLSLSPSGMLTGTPTANGTFPFAIKATDNLGFSGTQSYTFAVAANPPVANPLTAETLDGQPVTINIPVNDPGTVTSVAIATAPANGSASVSGTAITYTPAASFTGTDTLQYTLTGPGGTSAPATITVTVRPRPVPVAQQVSTASAKPVTVDLTKDASGGPFTGASLVSVPPATTGTVQLNGYEMTFTPAPAFSGTATVTFTLSNAYATSAVTAITIEVAERPDPTRDSEVMGVLNAQTEATRRFASSQIGNFQQRLEALHDLADAQELTDNVTFVQGVVFAMDSSCGQFNPLAQAAGSCTGIQPAADPNWRVGTGTEGTAMAPKESGTASGSSHSKVTVWTGGSINIGDSDGFDFQTTGLSGGIDYRVTRDLVLGVGGGYGRDTSDVGDNGSRSTGSSYTAAFYASYQPGRYLFLDGVTGYQWLSFDPQRYITSGGGFAEGDREGGQWFASIAAGGKFALDAWRISPYARLDVARASLDAYTEGGEPTTALHYGQQDVNTTTGNLGITIDYDYVAEFGTVSPQLRLQYQHDFQGDSEVSMTYADLLDGPFYYGTLDGLGQDRLLLGAGLNIQTTDDIALRLEYRGLFGSEGDSDNGFLVNLGTSF